MFGLKSPDEKVMAMDCHYVRYRWAYSSWVRLVASVKPLSKDELGLLGKYCAILSALERCVAFDPDTVDAIKKEERNRADPNHLARVVESWR